jgi:ATP-dependent RNA helicase DBP3
MSDETPELTKEQKRQRKEEKRAKKAAKAAQAEGSGSKPADLATEIVPESTEKVKKHKKDKKEKRKAEAELPPAGEEKPNKKKKFTATTPAITPNQDFTDEHNTYLSTNAITLLPPLYPPHLSIPSLPVDAAISKFLTRFTSPTPIQACSWPPLLANRDVVGIAETGSGKTLGFGVPGLQRLSLSLNKGKGKSNKSKGVIKMLVLAPTRELALQSHETLVALGAEMGVGSVCVYGGVGKDEQMRGLRDGKTGIVVGTPGRMLDLADAGDLDLSSWVDVWEHC